LPVILSQWLAFVGDSLNSSLVAVVSVDPDVLKAWAASQGVKVVPCFTRIRLLGKAWWPFPEIP